MTPTTAEYEYYEWLISQIETPRNDKTYLELFNRLHNVEFAWTVANDDNRCQDGLALRYEFSKKFRDSIRNQAATVLEVLIALSRRMSDATDEPAPRCAWRLLKNIRLNRISDPWDDKRANKVDDILEALIWRTYHYNGQGGFFPLKHPEKDQTKIEIWYQMQAYVIERDSR